jgi:hypothetical protein
VLQRENGAINAVDVFDKTLMMMVAFFWWLYCPIYRIFKYNDVSMNFHLEAIV